MQRIDCLGNRLMTAVHAGACRLVAMSPILLRDAGFRFSFWANEAGEPPHVHVRKGGAAAKWWLAPVREDRSQGFNSSQRARIRRILEEHHDTLLERWHATFGTN
jgi:hypothetical protein